MVVSFGKMFSYTAHPGNHYDYSQRLINLASLWSYFPGAGNPLFKDSNASIDISTGEPEPSSFSPSAVKCPQCLKVFAGFDTLKEHMQTCHPERPPAYSCLQCNATFSNRDQLDKHELLHSPNAQVSCKVCNKTFANVYRLQRHMISHDESAILRKFKCPQCDKAFKFKHHLKEHIRIHSGEKPFECANCGKRFSHSGSYSSHMTSKKCLIMNLKVNHRSRNNDSKIANGPQQNFTTNRVSLNKQKVNASNNTNNNNNKNTANNNNNILFPILSKYDGQGLVVPSYGNHPFYLPTSLPMNHQNLPYTFAPSSFNQMLLSLPLNPNYQDNNEHEDKGQVMLQNGDLITIKNEIKSEEDDEELKTSLNLTSSKERNTGNDLDAVKRILETVNTKQLFASNMPKLSSASCSSGCPSVSSEVPSPAVEDQTQQIEHRCKYCHRGFHSFGDLQQHEKYQCREVENEGLAAKLKDVVSNHKEETNGASNCNSDSEEDMQGCGKDYTMTEDEDSETMDGRKVRVRSQIAEEQLTILKQYYRLNPRPKREELVKISQEVGFPVRVVQVWFQNNRARDRREGRLVHIPYVPGSYPSFAFNIDQPLDLSTKKSFNSSPMTSPYRYDSDECGAVNLSRKSPSVHQPFGQGEPMDQMPPLESKMRLPQRNVTPNGTGGGYFSMDRIVYVNSSHSPVTSSSPNYNGSCSPHSSDSWKQDSVNSNESHDAIKNDAKSTEDTNDGQTIVALTKKAKLSSNNIDLDIEGQFSCQYCDKAFTKQSSLARHKYEHSGQRPHKCDICCKAFKHKHHLTEHKRLHSGEKPFQCSKCLKRFSHSGSYSQHMNHRYSYCKPYRD